MLEIRNICKTYRAKSGVEVRALDNVSLTFPDHGMVFLLGKSGSGKSTLLNVVGGLDTFDSGELVIRDRSSRTFRRSDFDSYRNTFIGFIFQEYNILDDFSVGANIGLALELQGKRATSEEINRILEEVDLAGFGNRKPNELSGGQKQRIAIARALIKDPQIIMADEPTGALDSTTGEQVLETLKKLSERKLVIVVSHDRDFAETYADRIIELADGCVISDTSITEGAVSGETAASDAVPVPDRGMHIVSDTQIAIADGYVLTEADLAAINDYLASHKNDVTIVRHATTVATEAVKRSVGRVHAPTGKVETKSYSAQDAKFIRSRLPMKKAAKMGLSSIKSKPIRLMFTILLSLVAFTLFGYSATAIFYNKTDAARSSLRDMNENSVVLSLRLKEINNTYNELGELDYSDVSFYNSDAFNDKDIENLEAATGMKFFPVYNGGSDTYSNISLWEYVADDTKFVNPMSGNVFSPNATGVTEMTTEDLATLGFTLLEDIPGSRMPSSPGEIAIPYYLYQMFVVGGFKDAAEKKYTSPVGQTLQMKFSPKEVDLKIVGVIDTGFDFSKYPALLWDAAGSSEYRSKDILDMRRALEEEVANSFHTMLMGASGTLELMPKLSSGGTYKEWGTYLNSNLNVGTYRMMGDKEELMTWYINRAVGKEQASAFNIVWADANKQTAFMNNEDYVISAEYFYQAFQSDYLWRLTPIPNATLKQHLKDSGYSIEQPISLYDHIMQKAYIYNEELGHDEEFYQFAHWMGIDNTTYESVVTEVFNEIYGLNLTFSEYKGLFSKWTPFLNDITTDSTFDMYRLYLWKEMYNNYEDLSATLMNDPDFYSFVMDCYRLDRNQYRSLNMLLLDMQTSGQITADAKRAVVSDLAARYLHQKWNEGDKDAELVLFGYNVNTEYNKYITEHFRTLTEEQRSYIFTQTRYSNNGNGSTTETTHVITGIYFPNSSDSQENGFVLSPYYNEQAKREQIENNGGYRYETIAGTHERGKYAMAIAAKPTDANAINALVDMHYSEDGEFVFRIESGVMDTLDMVNEIIVILDKVFLGVGVFFALFASLMMFNFISVSITNKKREIGILRALGARSRDVFLIFFTEAFFVAIINFILSVIFSFAGVFAINLIIRNELGFNLTLFSFDLRQIVLLFAVSVVVAFVSSFLPTNGIARKTPIDAMRDR